LTKVDLRVLSPKGIIAANESWLIIFSMGLMLSIAIPVVLIAYFVVWRFRAGNKKSKYMPEWTGNKFIKGFYWLFFVTIALFFFVVIWNSSHALDPYKPIPSGKNEVVIQVVALDWKWLFIYPDENIATVNFIQIPINTPVRFELTADAPMNSFWIPQLSGQIYSMASMKTVIHMRGDELGDFGGGAAEINGEGFSGMRFTTRVSSKSDYDSWLNKIRISSGELDESVYSDLAKPSEYNPVVFYSPVKSKLFDDIMMKYMIPENSTKDHMDAMKGEK
jgi:cytochrome o ubiquinol oxidase subunit 2